MARPATPTIITPSNGDAPIEVRSLGEARKLATQLRKDNPGVKYEVSAA